ncbi:uncharacterized protein NECHADRAFT_74799 [Fusarium vanettenii 77-13-4]|uniref:Uncharacterized protein n=1 Tax=Fusarium vanettenii (strain ATCC MYA-4622 / CBS 123669 / FGSC 9596 / NRRL 45880 / 77-13-4) TaxID=660122 RepID=C7YH00_FUSV7|nr:uncharacterized protein NECHADRAFT_74799 [Fusarium vanettenii 77-13-4]EEU48548.1 predicted protein [Fusarium vanettenii 77-13-4]
MALEWFSQLFPCFSVRRVHDSVDVPDVAPETRSVSGRSLSSERRYVTERKPSIERQYSERRKYLERRLSLESQPPKGHEETLSWLDNGNDSGVIAARDAADREMRYSIPSNGSEISYGATQAIRIQRDFDRDENGLDLFAVGTPGSTPFTPDFSPAPPTKEIPIRRRSRFSREPSSLDITRFDRSPPSSTVSSPSGVSRTDHWRHLDLPYAGAVWPLDAGYESFSERINALSLAVPKKNQEAEEDIDWKRGNVNSQRPVLHIDTELAPMVRPRVALVESPSENGSQAHKLPEMPPIVPPYNNGSQEDDSPKLTPVLNLASETRRDLGHDSSSSLDGRAESPSAPVKDPGIGSMTSDGDNRHDEHPESPVIDKLGDDNDVNPDAPADSPTSTKTDSTTIEGLIEDINGFLDGIAASCALISDAPQADRLADDSNSQVEVPSEPAPPSPMGIIGILILTCPLTLRVTALLRAVT